MHLYCTLCPLTSILKEAQIEQRSSWVHRPRTAIQSTWTFFGLTFVYVPKYRKTFLPGIESVTPRNMRANFPVSAESRTSTPPPILWGRRVLPLYLDSTTVIQMGIH
jgi:hypothetical protein